MFGGKLVEGAHEALFCSSAEQGCGYSLAHDIAHYDIEAVVADLVKIIEVTVDLFRCDGQVSYLHPFEFFGHAAYQECLLDT